MDHQTKTTSSSTEYFNSEKLGIMGEQMMNLHAELANTDAIIKSQQARISKLEHESTQSAVTITNLRSALEHKDSIAAYNEKDDLNFNVLFGGLAYQNPHETRQQYDGEALGFSSMLPIRK